MECNTNNQIVARLARLAKNEMEWNQYPRDHREEYIFLSNLLNCSKHEAEREFSDAFQKAVGDYKHTLKQGKGFGWFHNADLLCWLKMKVNQLAYAIYGDGYEATIVFNSELGDEAYKDLIMQIDRTALMSESELKDHYEEMDKIVAEMIKEISSES